MEDTPFVNLSENARSILSELTRQSFQDMERIDINLQIRIELLDKLIEFYKIHFENIAQINSLKVLREIFH